jgi:glucan 1,3-beta-glucosidase
MKGQGITTVRLPISYYHFLPGHFDGAVRSLMKGTEYEQFAQIYRSAFACIERTIQKAAQYEIGVLIDLHAAPGAQNTDGHSGLSNGKANFYNDANMSKTLSILKAIVETFGGTENVTAIELINEPQHNGRLADWYKDAINHLRTTSNIPIVLGDCWNPTKYRELIKDEEQTGTLILDHHYYRCFTPQDCSKSAAHHAAEIQPGKNGPAFGHLKEHSSKLNKNIIIGEWSAALNPGSLKDCGNDKKKHQMEWARAQLNAFNDQCAGHFFWTLKKEGHTDVGWCLYSAIEQGILPSGLGRPRNGVDISQLEEKGRRSLEENYQGHVKYWNQHNGGKQMHHEKYRDGFAQLYKDCIDFYRSCGDEIGFGPHWVACRAAAHSRDSGSKDGEWEFHHGGNMAITCFLGALWS